MVAVDCDHILGVQDTEKGQEGIVQTIIIIIVIIYVYTVPRACKDDTVEGGQFKMCV